MGRKKKVVVIGGGSGIFNVLKGLKNTNIDLTSVVTTFDNGGSTGILRDEFGILPPGDIRRSLLALSPDSGSGVLRELLTFRYPKESSLKGHNFGNLFLQALMNTSSDEIEAIEKAGMLLGIKGKVFPISTDNSHLFAELENGEIIEGETNIDIPQYDGDLSIERVFLKPKASISVEAKEAIINADYIIFGPGDFYTSIIPNTLVSGFKDAVSKSKAKTILIANIMTKWGETKGFKISDFARVLLEYIGVDHLDFVVCNKSNFREDILKKYEEEKAQVVGLDRKELERYTKNIILENLVTDTKIIRHDAEKIKNVILKII